ncbi:MAG: hypothetical protein M8364_01245 [Methylobacter sp.]|uniref:hypothetical protein n=1 Tax=Methylobacter sp. TaxID=2051955 RepID=UPI0025839BA2|nr:hypothetical protein [Methylobacter sp.]MCL7419519.1 hypothetical protein [Methylobacter sp.]
MKSAGKWSGKNVPSPLWAKHDAGHLHNSSAFLQWVLLIFNIAISIAASWEGFLILVMFVEPNLVSAVSIGMR